MVETTDGATLAQLSLPDMRLPIGYALAYPDRLPRRSAPSTGRRWPASTSSRPTARRSPAWISPTTPAGRRHRAGLRSTAPTRWRSPPSSMATSRWTDISGVIEDVLAHHDTTVPASVDDVLAADRDARHTRSRP